MVSTSELTKNMSSSKKADSKNGELVPSRYITAFMTMMGLAIIYPQRGNMSVAIVAMVGVPERNDTFNSSLETRSDACPLPPSNNSTDYESLLHDGEFQWSQTMQGFILGGFFYGYVITQPLGGRMSDMFGAKIVFAVGVIISSVMSLLTPLAARWNVTALIAVRVIIGLAQSFNAPATFSLMVKWAPPAERGLLLAIALLGAQIGNIIVMPITGYLCDSNIMEGWPATFYIFGSAGFVWLGFWWFLVYDSPAQHPRISEKELAFLNKEIKEKAHPKHAEPESVPWVAMLTSPPVLALAWVKFCLAWNYNSMLTKLPSYMESVLHYDINDNSSINSILYGVAGLSLIGSGYIADIIIKRSSCRATVWRRVFQAFSSFGTSACLFLVPTAKCDSTFVVTLLIVNMAFYGTLGGGEQSNGMEIAPRYSGLLSGVCNSFASISGFLSPLISGIFLEGNEESATAWGTFFYISAAMNVTGGIAFVFFSSSSVQPWAKMPDEQDQMESNNVQEEKGEDNKGYVEKY